MSNKLRAAAKAALDWLESTKTQSMEEYLQVIDSLKTALAEPEEKLLSVHRLDQWLKASLAEQKPMLEMNPQKREWVGLTDEERRGLREWQKIQEELGPVWAPMMLYLYEAIEAKLKEKNT